MTLLKQMKGFSLAPSEMLLKSGEQKPRRFLRKSSVVDLQAENDLV
jgi:hypothetical protein